MRFFLLSIILCCCLTTSAQEKKTAAPSKMQYRAIVQAGMLAGSTAESGQMQLINGVQFHRLYTGIGTGLDFYMYRGIPLFADVRYDVLKKKGTLFAYADGGIHFPWVKNQPDESIQKFYNGIYTDAGIGYRFHASNKTGLFVSAGYSYKQVKQRVTSLWFTPWPIEPVQQYEFRNYYLNRISIKLGWMF
mgnify:CR=1 FL=1